jgi:hypothetical protein
MSEKHSMDLESGGGGGIINDNRPTAEDDHEPELEPSPEVMRELLYRNSMDYIIQSRGPHSMGFLPPSIKELYDTRSRSDTLPSDIGSILLGELGIDNKGYSRN